MTELQTKFLFMQQEFPFSQLQDCDRRVKQCQPYLFFCVHKPHQMHISATTELYMLGVITFKPMQGFLPKFAFTECH